MKKTFTNVILLLIVLSALLTFSTSAENRQVTVANLPDNVTLRMRSEPVDGATIGRTWNGSQFEVLDTAVDSDGNEWLYVGAWIAGWYTEEETFPPTSPYFTGNLPRDTKWAVLLTDNVDGVAVPRMNQEDWVWNNNNPAVSYPETVRYTTSSNPDASKYAGRAIDPDIMNWVIDLNAQNNDNAVMILLNPGSGWINKEYPEFLLTAGAWVVVEEETNTAIRVRTLPWEWEPVYGMNHRNAHPFINHFVAIHTYGYKVDISSGGNGTPETILTPNLCPGDAWIQKTDNWADVRYWFPPEVPFDVTVTSTSGLSIRSAPVVSSDTWVGSLPYETEVTILAYYPSDNGVWGLTDLGYISLQYLSYPGDRSPWYGTTWKVDPLAVPPPRPTYDY